MHQEIHDVFPLFFLKSLVKVQELFWPIFSMMVSY